MVMVLRHLALAAQNRVLKLIWRPPSVCRSIVTSCVAVPPSAPIERTEVLVLSESSLYSDSWRGAASAFFPSRGLQFCSIDIFRSRGSNRGDYGGASLRMLEQNLVTDLSHLGDALEGASDNPTSSPAHVVLVARGPIQCLVAQYFLER